MTDDLTRIRKRSVRLAGHQTSISIEDAFWDHFTRIAAENNVSLNGLITEIDAQRSGNLSSAIRVYVLNHLSGADAPSETT